MRKKRMIRLVAVAVALVAVGALLAVAAGDGSVIYEGNGSASWRWREDALPDQYLALVLDAADLQLVQLALPEYVWTQHAEQLTDWVQSGKAAVVAYLGEAATGGYAIRVRQVRVDAQIPRPVVTVVVDRRSPAPGEFVTMAITHPIDTVPLERKRLPEPPFLVRFVDGNGRLLSQQRVAAAAAPAMAASAVPELSGELRVVGYGEVKVAPDRATVGFAVVGRAETAPEAQQIMNGQLAAVLGNLRDFGLPDANIRTRQFHLNPQWRYEEGQAILIGYEARTQLEVHLDQLERLGELVQTLVDAGVTEVSRIQYGLKDVRAVQEAALREAALDARWRGETLAKALGQRIVGIIEAQDQTRGSAQPVPLTMRTAMAMDEAAATPEFLPDDLSVRAEVVVVFRVTEH